MKRKLVIFSFQIILIPFTIVLGQSPLIIDHHCTDLSEIPANWIDSAQTKLYIAYGHTSHGSQLASGMNAIESYYSDGKYDWSHTGGAGQLHLFEGDGYGEGYMDHDCGYSEWDAETREYLDLFPECNVIIWSWCGQVNSVDLPSHYLTPMSQLESEYPDVKFVYMTGHLEGQGPDGSLFTANQQIRDYCNTNNKILFDFADIEKYDPDQLSNYQQYSVNDECNYTHPEGGTRNWATDWVNANPDHELTEIAALCTSCAHSEGLNCVQKGIAAWWLWAKLAGWEEANLIPGDPIPDVVPLSDLTNECSVDVLSVPTATDTAGNTVTASHEITLPITNQGTTVVTWTYTDIYGNSSTQGQNVVISDLTAPIPDKANLDDVINENSVTNLIAPTATDNCGGAVTVSSDAILPITLVGTTVVTWSYTDENDNSSTQIQNIVITGVVAIENTTPKTKHFYPNPTTDILYLRNETPGIHIVISDLQGRIIIRKQLGNTKRQISLGDLADGTYIVRLINTTGNSSQSLVVKY